MARRQVALLLASILVIALCGITYELLIGTLASYLLGNSVMQFSLTIGLFLSSMGLGSYLSQYVRTNLLRTFVLVEVLVGLVGGLSAPVLFASFAVTALYRPVMVAIIVLIGTLVGLEIPLLTRVIRGYAELRVAISQVLTWDYAGALVGSLIFPLVLLPRLGLIPASLVVGLANTIVALATVTVFRRELRRARLLALAGGVAAALAALLAAAPRLTLALEAMLYREPVVYQGRSPFQRIVLTRWRDDLRLYLDGNLQFSSTDEHRYHEALVHPALAAAGRREEVLVLGGGDGLAVREILKWPEVARVTLVDLDPVMTKLARELPALRALGRDALRDPRVTIVHQDAYAFLADGPAGRPGPAVRYNAVIVDLPDPQGESLAKLYSREMYLLLGRHLAADGVIAVQSTSATAAPECFRAIGLTLAAAALTARPYHVYVPSFGDWGFHLAAHPPWRERLMSEAVRVPVPTTFLDQAPLRALFSFPPAAPAAHAVRPSTLADPVVVEYYRRWRAESGVSAR